MRKYFLILIVILSISIFAGNSGTVVTTGSLFEEMIDMTNLSYFPDPVYRNVQYSSYDHRSQIPAGPDWFAYNDGFGGEPIPNFEKVLKSSDENGIGEYLIADVDGPGAIVRLWTAWIKGTIKMYIDGSNKPVYDGSAREFFQNTFDQYREMKKIDTERFKKTIYQQDASYTPIPFAKHLRLIWIGKIKEIHFYQVQVRLYDKSTTVESFSRADIAKYRKTIDNVSQVLSNQDENIKADSKQNNPFKATIAPSERKKILRVEGSQALKILTLRLQANNIDKALRQTVLQIICDEYPWGQVQSPVGYFWSSSGNQSLPVATLHCAAGWHNDLPFCYALQ